jgi:hypothetical protein
VNRTIKALEAEGLITRKSSRSVTIGNWKNSPTPAISTATIST